jgi:hypothetical protein
MNIYPNVKQAPMIGMLGMGGGNKFTGNFSSGSGDDYYLVWSMDASGSVVNNYTTHNFNALAEGQTGVNFTSYSNIPTGWDRLVLTSKNRGTVWTFANNTETRRWLESLCNPISSWTSSKNATNNVYPREGSSRYATTGTLYNMIYQHNNNGGETHDICTLGNTGGDVWTSGMYWGNIDYTSNYGGLMNQYDATSGSGGSATGDTLYAYVKYNHSTTASDYTNYLTPTGPLGNAQNMSWSHSGNSGLGGDPSRVADAVDRSDTSSWASYGFQQAGNSAWIQVDLGAGNETAFDYTFAIGYPGGSHDSDKNYVEASNDNSTWVKMAEWGRHNNNLAADYGGGYLFNNNGAWVYSDALTYMGIWHAIKNRTAYRYWRIGGTAFNWSNGNGHQLVMNWALLKKT